MADKGLLTLPPCKGTEVGMTQPQYLPRGSQPVTRSSEASRGAAGGRRRRGESRLTRSPASSEQATVILAPRKRRDRGDRLADKPCPPAASRAREPRGPRRAEAGGPAAGKPDPAGPAALSRRRPALEAGAPGTLRRHPRAAGSAGILGGPDRGRDPRRAGRRRAPCRPGPLQAPPRAPAPPGLPAKPPGRPPGSAEARGPASQRGRALERGPATPGPGQPRAARPLAHLLVQDGGSRRQGPGRAPLHPRGRPSLPLRLLPARGSLPFPDGLFPRVASGPRCPCPSLTAWAPPGPPPPLAAPPASEPLLC
ncbi:translation initiation factor IF-2-like [Moschus berezovskii]|uniref:translation initiation factor IF-2-like n=1 Tax=Moschus berezovskii TaxID=68408 RepID=UPI00244393D5|nr:translation initiation factor IF-2-like [Moschus berezovskii]